MRTRLKLLEKMKREGIILEDIFFLELPMVRDSNPDLINVQRVIADATAELGQETDRRCPTPPE